MTALLEQSAPTQNILEGTVSQEKTRISDRGNVSLAMRSNRALLELPDDSSYLVLDNGDAIMARKFQKDIHNKGLIRTDHKEADIIHPHTFPLVIGNIGLSNFTENMEQIHALSQPFADVFLNIYSSNRFLPSQERIDEIIEKYHFYIRSAHVNTDRKNSLQWWEIDMIQNPKDLPSYRRSGPYSYRTGSNWEEFYYE